MSNDRKQDTVPDETAPQTPQEPGRAPGSRADEDENLTNESDEPVPGSREALENELADLKDRYLRLVADMDNLRKRTEREKADMAKYAVSEFARDVLSLSDNFQRAINSVPDEAAGQDENLSSFLEGVKMNERELQKVLERHGVARIDPKGEKFDPNMHQAVQQVDRPDLPNNTVCDVYQVGYTIADRVLRPAVVAVAKGGSREQGEQEGMARQESAGTASPRPQSPSSSSAQSAEGQSAPHDRKDGGNDETDRPASAEPGSVIDKNA